MGLQYLGGLAGDVEASIISYNKGRYSTCMERARLGVLICKLGTFTVKQSSTFQLKGAGSIRPQLHMIFHFVEIGDCEALVKWPFGVGGCPDIAR